MENALIEWAKGRPKGQHRRTCPHCSHTRRKRNDPCLAVNVEDDHFTYHCWHCGAKGAERLKPMERNRSVKTVIPLTSDAEQTLLDRKISHETIARYGIREGVAYFPNLQREERAVVFPYVRNHVTVGEKLRALYEKAFVCSKRLSTPFGMQLVDMEDNDVLTICEGEMDCLSLDTVGIPNVVSAPNGAATFTELRDDAPIEDVYGFLWPLKDAIDKAKRIIVATDADVDGTKFGEEIARRIGYEKCWRLNYPDGLKDSNEVLQFMGPEALVNAWSSPEPWPVSGLYEADDFFDEADSIYHKGFAAKVSTGIDVIDELYSPSPGLLTVVTGVPSHGKSTFIDQLMVNLARSTDAVSAVCSFENQPAVHIGKIAEMLARKHFFPTSNDPENRMSYEEYCSYKEFIHRHFKFIHDKTGDKSSLESIIDRIKMAVYRWGVRYVVIDPYNYIQRPKSMDSETQWIDEMLTKLRMLAQNYKIHIWMVAHPTKLQYNADGSLTPPKGYHISGSAAWFSKADFGLTVHRPEPDTGSAVVEIHNWKTRFNWIGQAGKRDLLYYKEEHYFGHGVDLWDE